MICQHISALKQKNGTYWHTIQKYLIRATRAVGLIYDDCLTPYFSSETTPDVQIHRPDVAVYTYAEDG